MSQMGKSMMSQRKKTGWRHSRLHRWAGRRGQSWWVIHHPHPSCLCTSPMCTLSVYIVRARANNCKGNVWTSKWVRQPLTSNTSHRLSRFSSTYFKTISYVHLHVQITVQCSGTSPMSDIKQFSDHKKIKATYWRMMG